jgi:AcrR family transcriptional regulator
MRLRPEARAARFEALLRAGLELIREQGFAQTTVDQITQKAGVGKGAFYTYFETKEDLVLEAIAFSQAGGGERLKWLLTERHTTRERIRTILRYALAWVESYGELIFIYIVERVRRGRGQTTDGARSHFAHMLAQVFALGQEQGDVRRDRTPAMLAMDVEGIMLAHIISWYHRETEGPLAEGLLSAVDTYLDGALLDGQAPISKEEQRP